MHVLPRFGIALLFVALALACGGGKAGEQPSVCEDYVECVSAVNPDGLGAAIDTYGPDGTCWADNDEEEAELCTTACKNGLGELADAHPREADCTGPTASLPSTGAGG